jgi:hypothetical protein
MNIKAFITAMYVQSVAHDEHCMIEHFTTWIMNDELLNQAIVLSNNPYYYLLSVKGGLSPLVPSDFDLSSYITKDNFQESSANINIPQKKPIPRLPSVR